MTTVLGARTISARQAHVEHEQDLLAHSVVRLDQRSTYLAMVTMPDDRPAEQGLLDAGQQVVRAICHLFEGVPGDHGIAIHHTEIKLLSPTSSDVPMEASVHLEIDRDNPRHFLWQCESTIDFWQGLVRVAQAHIKGMTLPRTVGDPMMRRHHARHAPIAA